MQYYQDIRIAFSWAENQNLNLLGFDSESSEMFLTQAVTESNCNPIVGWRGP